MPNGLTSGWTDERIEFLKKRWADGASASVIADELGPFSRSAVIGKVHRLGLDYRKTVTIREAGVDRRVFGSRAPGGRMVKRRRMTASFNDASLSVEQQEEIRKQNALIAEALKAEVVDLAAELRAKAVTFAQLDKPHCKWPYGDPRKPDFVFCGCGRMPGSPYCAPHTRIASGRAADA